MKVLTETTDIANTKWIDARYDLNDADWGRRQYEAEHVEGAVYWDLEKDLSDMGAGGGRHPMPSKEQLTRLIRKSGLSPEDTVVVYDQGASPFAARAWWLLQYAGFSDVRISRLGFDELKARGIRVTDQLPEVQATDAELTFKEEIYADQAYVKSAVAGDRPDVLLDARSEARYRGIEEPIDPVAGRIPGARNYDWTKLIEKQKLTREPDFSSVVLPPEPIVVYCGSGVTAAPLYAMLKEAGHDQVRLYTGSYSDWISNKDNPVEFDRPEHPDAADEETKAILGRLIAEGYSGEMLMKKFEYEKALLNNEK